MSDTTWGFSQTFLTEFQEAQTDLKNRLDALQSTSTTQAIQNFSIDLAKFAKKLDEATGSLPNYDQKQCELQIKSLERDLDLLRTKSTPKARFAFKKKAPAPVPAATAPTSSSVAAPVPLSTPTTAAPSNLVLSSRTKSYLDWAHIPTSAVPSGQCDLTISNLSECIVNVLPPPSAGSGYGIDVSAIHVNNVKRSILILPRIKGSVLLHDMEDVILVVGCHQFRMHTSKGIDVYLAILSNPIIEHCSAIRFAPYPVKVSGVPTETSLNVQDFSHIRASPSPNWSLLEEGKGNKDWPLARLDEETEVVNVVDESLKLR